MSRMSDLDAELREAGIDPEGVDLDADGGFIIPEGSEAQKQLLAYLLSTKSVSLTHGK